PPLERRPDAAGAGRDRRHRDVGPEPLQRAHLPFDERAQRGLPLRRPHLRDDEDAHAATIGAERTDAARKRAPALPRVVLGAWPPGRHRVTVPCAPRHTPARSVAVPFDLRDGIRTYHAPDRDRVSSWVPGTQSDTAARPGRARPRRRPELESPQR